jgi:cyclic pyranopterin phosphate synthase
MPKEVFGKDYAFLERKALLSFEEITRLARIFVALGTRKIRLTGGEPLVRKGLPELVAQLRAIDGLDDLTLTTNGSLLAPLAGPLKEAGLDRVTVSLDSLDDEVFQAMNDVGVPVARVLAGIDAAAEAGLRPIKVNAVVKRGLNDHTVVDLARHFRGTGHILRFIEFMDVGNTNGWKMDHVVPARELIDRISAEMPIEPVDPNYPGEVAKRWRYVDGSGEIGFITSITNPFCGACTRARLSPEGQLFTCLFGAHGFDLRTLLRSGASDADIEQAVRTIWQRRTDRYSEIRSEATADLPRVEMSRIGG